MLSCTHSNSCYHPHDTDMGQLFQLTWEVVLFCILKNTPKNLCVFCLYFVLSDVKPLDVYAMSSLH